MRPQDFYTKTRASAGIRIELIDPAGNKEWVRVRSVISDEHRRAREELVRQAVADGRIVANDPSQRKALARRRRAVLAASLVADWSIQAEPADLFIKNPRLRRQVELIAENHALHFGAAE
ncbi:hypothetical protein [Pelagibacterium sp.]|uniref:hypothetical protein n=1 Tax=Pelagibacterium sp. TaxID=1967288 RepID=UPI003A929B74